MVSEQYGLSKKEVREHCKKKRSRELPYKGNRQFKIRSVSLCLMFLELLAYWKQRRSSRSYPSIPWDLFHLIHGVWFLRKINQTPLVYSLRELDPAPNPPHFPSYVIKATLDHISNCHKSELKSLVAVLSKSPVSMSRCLIFPLQYKILLLNTF